MITKEELLEIGFIEESKNDLFYGNNSMLNIYGDSFSQVDILIYGQWITVPNATTIQDIKDLIRLFNIKK